MATLKDKACKIKGCGNLLNLYAQEGSATEDEIHQTMKKLNDIKNNIILPNLSPAKQKEYMDMEKKYSKKLTDAKNKMKYILDGVSKTSSKFSKFLN